MPDVTEPALTLFDVKLEAVAAPLCRLCTRPAWRRRDGRHDPYCGTKGCTSRERLCAHCGGGFQVNTDGAGTKYCSTDCKRGGYGVAWGRPAIPCCAWCGERASTTTARQRTTVWPYLCRECIAPIAHLVTRLRGHKVPHEMAKRLLDNPGCEVCGRDIVTKVRDGTTGSYRSLLVVDHDHDCCPGSRSCGLCVRGLLCGTCNSAAGMLGDDPDRARALGVYLDRFTNR